MNYLAYGLAVIRSEAIYNILNYDAVAEAAMDTRILIYTKDIPAFQQLLGSRYDVVYPAVQATQ
ncbi:hypothetical protein CDA63_00410 [Hymenobacter amundsenii]|uniref:Uncharacterized protein n=1 Tax=Hymenobacter amundsenii TaxID=2006685 RepID=A0A246FQ33_9BACT|nr:hypothetical protein [Hymenobacter amundsenii]OWP64861.1 hypothetical protein CDA63_00410 [Hymenobacter amundsenii]